MNHKTTFSQFTADLRQFISDSISDPQRCAGSEEGFNRLALRLFQLQFEANTPFRRFCEAQSRLPGSVQHWRKVPAVPASGFKDTDLTCLDEENRQRVFCSSGTTGQRLSRHFHSEESLGIYEASLWPWFKAHFTPEPPDTMKPFPGLVILAPSPIEAPNSSLVHMFDHVRQRLRSSVDVFMASVTAGGSWVVPFEKTMFTLEDHVRTAMPVMLFGTAFSFVHLLDELRKRGGRLKLPAGSRLMETGGYKGRSRALEKRELHVWMRELLGLELPMVVSEYGMSELSSQAYDGVAGVPGRGIFRFPPWAQAQVVSPETGLEVPEGNAGLIRVLDLANVYSVMHVQTEDIGRRRGAGFELLGRAAAAEPKGCSLLIE